MSIKLIAKLEAVFKSVECDDSYKYYDAEHDYFDEEAYYNSVSASYQNKCEEYLFDYLYPDKQHVCPKCGKSHKLGRLVKRIQCTHCGHKKHWLSGTVFHHSKIPLIKWFKFFAYSTDTLIDNRYIAKKLRLNLDTITSMSNKLCEAKTMYGLDELFSKCCNKPASTLTRFSYMPRNTVKRRLRIAAFAEDISSPPCATITAKSNQHERKYQHPCKEPKHDKQILNKMKEKLTIKELACFKKTGYLPSRLLPPPEISPVAVLYTELKEYLQRQTPEKMADQTAFNKVANKLDTTEKRYIHAINSPDTTEETQWVIKMCLYKLRQWIQQYSESYDMYQVHKCEEERNKQAVEIHKNKTNVMREFINSHHEHQKKYGTAFQAILSVKDAKFWLERRHFAPLCILDDYARDNLLVA